MWWCVGLYDQIIRGVADTIQLGLLDVPYAHPSVRIRESLFYSTFHHLLNKRACVPLCTLLRSLVAMPPSLLFFCGVLPSRCCQVQCRSSTSTWKENQIQILVVADTRLQLTVVVVIWSGRLFYSPQEFEKDLEGFRSSQQTFIRGFDIKFNYSIVGHREDRLWCIPPPQKVNLHTMFETPACTLRSRTTCHWVYVRE
jgi:hypothetical protein